MNSVADNSYNRISKDMRLSESPNKMGSVNPYINEKSSLYI